MESFVEDMECHCRKSEVCALLKATGEGQTVLSELSKRFLFLDGQGCCLSKEQNPPRPPCPPVRGGTRGQGGGCPGQVGDKLGTGTSNVWFDAI